MEKGIVRMQLNSLADVDDDPLLLKATYSILDFFVSGNNQIVSKELAEEASMSLKGKPLLCVYTQNTSLDPNNPNDHFNDHGEQTLTDRYGEEYIGSNSIAIGTALDGGYIQTIQDKDGNDIEALLCDFYLWKDRNVEVLQLLEEMYNSEMPIYSSCEYYYSNYTVNGKVRTLLSPLLFSGHCILSSGENGNKEVLPAYDSSKLLSLNQKLNEAIEHSINEKQNNDIQNQETDVDIKNDNQKEDASMEGNALFKVLNELSHGDIREKLMSELSKVMTADEFKYVWISNYGIYDSYFIYENYVEDEYKNFKIPYEKMEADIVLKLDEKVEVQRDEVWVEVGAMEKAVNEVKESLNAKEVEVEGLNVSIKELNEKVEGLEGEKSDFASKMDIATNEIVDLTKQVNEMKPVVEQFNSEKLEQAINAQKDKFEEKFVALNAKEQFNSEEVQEMIKKSVCESDEGKEAILSLNSMLVELVKPIVVEDKKDEKIDIKELNSKKMENLIDTKDTFETRYFV